MGRVKNRAVEAQCVNLEFHYKLSQYTNKYTVLDSIL